MSKKINLPNEFFYNLAASPNFKQDGLLFAAKQSGLYRSKDGGQTWEDAYASLKLTTPLPTTFVAVAVLKARIYVFACVEGNVLRSLDGGENWEVAELGSPAPMVTMLLISPNFSKDGTLLAATMQDGILRSTNRGAAWSGWNFGLYDPNINALAVSTNFAVDQTILAGTQSGVFRSINGGRSWIDLDFPIGFAPVQCLAAIQNGGIYAGTEREGLVGSQDGGMTWKQLISGSVNQVLTGKNGEMLILKDGEIRFSADSGKSWEKRIGIEIDSDLSCLAAPLGLNFDHPLWVGFSDGKVLKI